jgi:hypothetical protein
VGCSQIILVNEVEEDLNDSDYLQIENKFEENQQNKGKNKILIKDKASTEIKNYKKTEKIKENEIYELQKKLFENRENIKRIQKLEKDQENEIISNFRNNNKDFKKISIKFIKAKKKRQTMPESEIVIFFLNVKIRVILGT